MLEEEEEEEEEEEWKYVQVGIVLHPTGQKLA